MKTRETDDCFNRGIPRLHLDWRKYSRFSRYPTRKPKRAPPRSKSPDCLNANSKWYHWDMLKHRPTCTAAVRRKRVVSLQEPSIRKANPISLCHRQTSRPPSKNHRRNQRQESAQVPAPGASLPSHCAAFFATREAFRSPATGSHKFQIQGQFSAQQRNREYSDATPLLGA